MKIYSWNMLFRTTERERAFAFIKQSDFDVFCIQEVPESFLPDLKSLDTHMAHVMDMERLFPYQPIKTYNVILSKYPIITKKEIPLPDYQEILPLRTRIARWILQMAHFSAIRNRNAMYADIQTPDGTIRIFNLHLILGHPVWREQEFLTALSHYDPTIPSVVCGDFNIIESAHMSILNWLLGGKIGDALLHKRERTTIEKQFVQYKLMNPLYGTVTHPFSRSQLDHILVSSTFTIQKADVLPDRVGSDHHPICVEIE